MQNQDTNSFNADHLTLNELKEIALEIHTHYLAVMAGDIEPCTELWVAPEELSREYMAWAAVIEERLDYEA